MSLLEVEDKLVAATNILHFLTGVTPDSGTIPGENEEHGRVLILQLAIENLIQAKEHIEEVTGES